ncbi:MAG: glycosyltransferase family 2 protein [Chloroflexota bacterium]|nr:glycosyltransferase family 2 protein [Chloroflexota bacterium]MDE2918743.1 glycosyltransferase family 2 protein [Chloroflexota bacterium]
MAERNMSDTPEASVVIVTWNGLRHLRRCLPALADQTGVEFETIVVDNGSTDGTEEWIAEAYPRTILKRLESNHGFSEANNIGFGLARADLVATLNNDAVPDSDWLYSLVQAAHEHPETGSFASRMVLDRDHNIIDSAGVVTDVLGIAWDRHNAEPVGSDEAGDVFGACAGAALYRKALLDETGGFDSAFFAYLEDVDLAWRARWLGWTARYVPEARVVHAHSATGTEESPFKTFYLGRNKVWTVAKNHPTRALLLYGPLLVAYDLASLPITMVRQRNLAALRGRLAGLGSLGPVLRLRKQVAASRRVAWEDIRPFVASPSWPWEVWRRQRRLRQAVAADGSPMTPNAR